MHVLKLFLSPVGDSRGQNCAFSWVLLCTVTDLLSTMIIVVFSLFIRVTNSICADQTCWKAGLPPVMPCLQTHCRWYLTITFLLQHIYLLERTNLVFILMWPGYFQDCSVCECTVTEMSRSYTRCMTLHKINFRSCSQAFFFFLLLAVESSLGM